MVMKRLGIIVRAGALLLLAAAGAVLLILAVAPGPTPLDRARRLVEIGDYAAAVPRLGELAKAEPGNVEVRLLTARAFAECDHVLNLPDLTPAHATNSERAFSQLELLAKLGPDGRKALCKAIADGHPRLALIAIRAAGQEGMEEAVCYIADFLEQGGLRVASQETAMEALAAIRGTDAADVLLRQAHKIGDARRQSGAALKCLKALGPEGRLELARKTTNHGILAMIAYSERRMPELDNEVFAVVVERDDVAQNLRTQCFHNLVSGKRSDPAVALRVAKRLVDGKSPELRKRALKYLASVAQKPKTTTIP